jgi:Flp pilus assembly protein TadG
MNLAQRISDEMRGERRSRARQGKSRSTLRERGAAAVELALVLPILLVIILGILDFGLYYYNDLQLTHAARDAARYLSVGNVTDANAAIDGASLVSTTISQRSLAPGSSGNEAVVTLKGTYTLLTPLPRLIGIGPTVNINATATMRRE